MEKKVVKIDPYSIKIAVAKGVCPLNWLAAFYKDYPGKLVMIDSGLFDYLLNKSKCNNVVVSRYDKLEHRQTLSLTWDATDKFPKSEMTVVSHGTNRIRQVDGQYVLNGDDNYYIVKDLFAEDILVDGVEYASNIKTDKQILFLTLEGLTDTSAAAV